MASHLHFPEGTSSEDKLIGTIGSKWRIFLRINSPVRVYTVAQGIITPSTMESNQDHFVDLFNGLAYTSKAKVALKSWAMLVNPPPAGLVPTVALVAHA